MTVLVRKREFYEADYSGFEKWFNHFRRSSSSGSQKWLCVDSDNKKPGFPRNRKNACRIWESQSN